MQKINQYPILNPLYTLLKYIFLIGTGKKFLTKEDKYFLLLLIIAYLENKLATHNSIENQPPNQAIQLIGFFSFYNSIRLECL